MSSTCPALSASGDVYMASSMTNINLLYSAVKDNFYVIFDTGTSLAISFDKNDFVGPIKTLANHRLGVISNGLTIEEIGTVK